MALSILTFLNGFSELILVLLGIFYFFRFMIHFFKQKKKMTPVLALLALSLGSMHLGGAVAFLAKLIWLVDLDIILYGFLTYIHLPFGLIIAIYLGFDIFKPKLKWWMVALYAVLGIAYLTAMIGWPDIMIRQIGTTAADTVIDVNVWHVPLGITIVYLATAVLVLGVNFLVLRSRMRTDEGEMKNKTLQLGIGWILFGFSGALCTLNPLNITIIPNSICFVALILIFHGFAPMKTKT